MEKERVIVVACIARNGVVGWKRRCAIHGDGVTVTREGRIECDLCGPPPRVIVPARVTHKEHDAFVEELERARCIALEHHALAGAPGSPPKLDRLHRAFSDGHNIRYVVDPEEFAAAIRVARVMYLTHVDEERRGDIIFPRNWFRYAGVAGYDCDLGEVFEARLEPWSRSTLHGTGAREGEAIENLIGLVARSEAAEHRTRRKVIAATKQRHRRELRAAEMNFARYRHNLGLLQTIVKGPAAKTKRRKS